MYYSNSLKKKGTDTQSGKGEEVEICTTREGKHAGWVCFVTINYIRVVLLLLLPPDPPSASYTCSGGPTGVPGSTVTHQLLLAQPPVLDSSMKKGVSTKKTLVSY